MKIDEQTRRALASYAGTITRCPPGEARGRPVFKPNGAAQWLSEHRDIVPVIDAAERLRRKKERARRRQRRRARNA
jgi:hypothetical protein